MNSGKSVFWLFLLIPVLVIVEFLMGLHLYRGLQDLNAVENQNNKLDLYLRTNNKYVSYTETAQRGYLLTGDHSYTDSISNYISGIAENERYYDTIGEQIKNPKVKELQAMSRHKMAIVEHTISLYDAGKPDSALMIVKTGIGGRVMDSIRNCTTEMRNELSRQIALEKQRQSHLWHKYFRWMAFLLLIIILNVWYTYRRISSYMTLLETHGGLPIRN